MTTLTSRIEQLDRALLDLQEEAALAYMRGDHTLERTLTLRWVQGTRDLQALTSEAGL